jgi:hypothetical protein
VAVVAVFILILAAVVLVVLVVAVAVTSPVLLVAGKLELQILAVVAVELLVLFIPPDQVALVVLE